MRQLRLVHRTEVGSLVVETTDGGEQFSLPVDAVLRTAVRSDLPRHVAAPSEPAPSEESSATGDAPIGPREIQVRVRAGESPEELSAAYGMALDRVLRFAGPVLDERRRIADEAHRARARRSTSDGAIVVFGEAVDERFAAHGIAPDTVTWDARRREDGEWVVVAEWSGGEGTHAAEWLFTRATRTVAPIDDTAADLLSDRPIRPVTPPEPERPALAAAPPLVAGIVSFPPMPDAHTGPVPVLEEVFDQDAAPEGPRELPRRVPAKSMVEPTLDFDAPPLPLGIIDPAERPAAAASGVAALRNGNRNREESEDDRAARAHVPSWDDILLGVRRHH